jgi:DNA polymerase (family 10)
VRELLARSKPAELESALSEVDVYARASVPFVPPELRDSEQALGRRYDDLVTESDVRGFVHCHTEYSDGRDSILEMARAAERRGAAYITITDHSQSAFYAGGLTIDRLERQWDEIAEAQQHVGVKILRGIESDILADGSLDYPDSVLERFDVIIASVHGRMRMDEAEMTRRLERAMRLPVFKIWGHALGRLLLRRPPFACQVERVLDAVAESRAAIEVNGDPHRLDLGPDWIRIARERRIPFVLSTDAHATRQLAYVHWSVLMARRGGLRKSEVLNTLETDAFMRAVRPAA